jgi:hypothetical protein
VDYVPAPEIKEIYRLHIERHNDYDFLTSEPAPYVVEWAINFKVKDIIVFKRSLLKNKFRLFLGYILPTAWL